MATNPYDFNLAVGSFSKPDTSGITNSGQSILDAAFNIPRTNRIAAAKKAEQDKFSTGMLGITNIKDLNAYENYVPDFSGYSSENQLKLTKAFNAREAPLQDKYADRKSVV